VIWENQEVEHEEILRRQFYTFVIITGYLGLILIGFMVALQFMEKSQQKYPSMTQCDLVSLNFEDNQSEFEKFARLDQMPTMNYHGHGVYQCYCKQYSTVDAAQDESDLCYRYQYDLLFGETFSKLVSAAIAGLNFGIAMANKFLIERIGYHQNSQVIGYVMQFVFNAQYVNTGILLLFTNANFETGILSFLPFKGQFSDFSSVWYLTIGRSIVYTMIFASVMPFVRFPWHYFVKTLFRTIDSKGTCRKRIPKTKKVTIQQFVNLYSSKDVELHFRYSSIMNFVFVAFTHGLALPILFPIAAFGIFNQWLAEKLLFAYFYKQPPLLDNQLNDRSLKILQKAPLAMMLLGYWQLGNRQMFFNEPSELVNAKDIVDSKHNFFHWDDGLSHIYIFLLVLPAFIFFKGAVHKLQQLMFKVKMFEPNKQFDQDWNLSINIDEDIGKYWECIPGMKQKRWFAQVTHL